MKTVRFIVVLTLFVTLILGKVCIAQKEDTDDDEGKVVMGNELDEDSEGEDLAPSQSPFLLGFRGRFLSQKKKSSHKMTCNKFPRICHAKGSPGPDCCKKKCVNVETDNHNCGECGLKCKHHEICCKGKCVDTRNDKKNCGRCGNKCKKGRTCDYGMCSYA